MSNDDKLAIFWRRFGGRKDAYGTYDTATGRSRCVRSKVTRRVLLNHLLGKTPFGVYLLTGETTRSAAVDFDQEDLNPVRCCLDQARHYGLRGYVERSKRKGYHVWFFFDRALPAYKPRLVLRMLLNAIDQPTVEIFPKQDVINPRDQLGNFINAPLFGAHVQNGRTIFMDPHQDWVQVEDQWKLLGNVQLITEQQLDELIEINDLVNETPRCAHIEPSKPDSISIHGLPPCAVKMLHEGVTENQRVCAFRLAVHFFRLGIPRDLTITMLIEWSSRNSPSGEKRIITKDEIVEQTGHAYSGRYRGYGCEDPIINRHCQGICPVIAASRPQPI